MYESPLKTFEEFYDDVMKGKNAKARYHTEVVDGIGLDIPSNTLQHDKNAHNLTKEEWLGLFNALNNGEIIEAKIGDTSVMNGLPVKMVVDINGTDYGVVFEAMKNGRNLVQTAFKLEDREWINKKSAKMSARYPQTYGVSLGHSLPDIISNLGNNVNTFWQSAVVRDLFDTQGDLFEQPQSKPTQSAQQPQQAKQLPAEAQKQVDDLFAYAEKQEGVKKEAPLFSDKKETQKIEKSYTAVVYSISLENCSSVNTDIPSSAAF